jgi:hypothetical protein
MQDSAFRIQINNRKENILKLELDKNLTRTGKEPWRDGGKEGGRGNVRGGVNGVYVTHLRVESSDG